MPASRSRTALLGVVLALLAVFGTSLLCTWHCATFHDEDAAAIVGLVQVGGTNDAYDRGLPGSPVHVAAHVACQGYVAPAVIAGRAITRVVARIWPAERRAFADGIDTVALLRPPRI